MYIFQWDVVLLARIKMLIDLIFQLTVCQFLMMKLLFYINLSIIQELEAPNTRSLHETTQNHVFWLPQAGTLQPFSEDTNNNHTVV